MMTHVDVSDQELMVSYQDGVWQCMYWWNRAGHPDEYDIWVKIEHRYGPCNGDSGRAVSTRSLRLLDPIEVIALAAL